MPEIPDDLLVECCMALEYRRVHGQFMLENCPEQICMVAEMLGEEGCTATVEGFINRMAVRYVAEAGRIERICNSE